MFLFSKLSVASSVEPENVIFVVIKIYLVFLLISMHFHSIFSLVPFLSLPSKFCKLKLTVLLQVALGLSACSQSNFGQNRKSE